MNMPSKDPYLQPSMSFTNRLTRFVWGIIYALLFRTSPRPFHAWRAWLLRLFGATLGPHCRVYPHARIWAPWNLICEDAVAIADEAIVYNPKPITLHSHSTVSQQAYLCGATHDCDDPAFPMIYQPITIGKYAWVCARSTVLMGITLGDGAVLGLGAIATHDLDPWSIYAGIPARKTGDRNRFV